MEWTPLLKWCLVFMQIFSLALLIIYLKLKKNIEDLRYELKEKTQDFDRRLDEKIYKSNIEIMNKLNFELMKLEKKK